MKCANIQDRKKGQVCKKGICVLDESGYGDCTVWSGDRKSHQTVSSLGLFSSLRLWAHCFPPLPPAVRA